MVTPAAEIELLLCAAGKFATSESLHDICARVADWNALIEAAEFHGLLPLLSRKVATAGAGAAPQEATARLNEAYLDGIKRALFFSAELQTLVAAFEEGGVPVISFKGPALGAMLYKDPALRPCSDLDLLVEPRRVADALRILAWQDFRLAPHLEALPVSTLVRFDCEARLRGRSIDVDLQWATAPKGHALSFDPAILWRARQPRRHGDQAVPGLSPEATLLFLCAHGAKHGWSRLIWLADIARLSQLPLDWDMAIALAGEARCQRTLMLGLALAQELLGTPTPQGLRRRAMEDRAVRAQVAAVRARLLRLPAEEPGSLALTNFSASLAKSLKDKLRHYTALILLPTEADFQIVSFPAKFFFLYFPLRIMRLAAKYAWRIFARV